MDGLIYKFLPHEYALQAIEEKRLKLTTLDRVNDAFDSLPRIGPADGDTRYLRAGESEYFIREQRKKSGLVCFSKSYSSPLLWGHYADRGTGIALGFHPDRLGYGDAFAVNYEKDRPLLRIPAGYEVIPTEITKELIKTVFSVKSDDWKYESEVRYVITLDECKPRNRMYFAPFCDVALKEVVLGYNCPVSADYIRRTLREHYKGFSVTINATEVHPYRFEVVQCPINRPLVWIEIERSIAP
jgi:Protein of unknown function (DUF2971)